MVAIVETAGGDEGIGWVRGGSARWEEAGGWVGRAGWRGREEGKGGRECIIERV